MTLLGCSSLENRVLKTSFASLKNLPHATYFSDMGSDVIPEDDDERGELYDDVDHPLPTSSPPASSQPTDDEIYEELPGIYHLVIHLRIFRAPPSPAMSYIIKLTT